MIFENKYSLVSSLSISAVVSVGLFFGACSQAGNRVDSVSRVDPARVDSKATHAAKGYLKPGAAVGFSSSYDGATELGEEEHFEIHLVAQSEGELRVTVTSADNILLGESGIEVVESVMAGDTIIIPVELQTFTAGKYYLNINTRLAAEGRSRDRAFALAIYAGSSQQIKNAKSMLSNKRSTSDGNGGENVIVLPAMETVTR